MSCYTHQRRLVLVSGRIEKIKLIGKLIEWWNYLWKCKLIDLITTSYSNQKSYTEAIQFLNSEFENIEEIDFIHHQKYWVYYEIGDLSNALKEIELALKINPEELSYYHLKKSVKHQLDTALPDKP